MGESCLDQSLHVGVNCFIMYMYSLKRLSGHFASSNLDRVMIVSDKFFRVKLKEKSQNVNLTRW